MRSTQLRTGALTVLSVFFALSAVLRAGDVVAELSVPRPDIVAAEEEFLERLDPSLGGASAVARQLDARRAALDAEAAAIDERRAALQEAEARLQERLEQMKEVRIELDSALQEAQGAAARDVAHLAETYARMKPKQAGALFNAMEPSFAAGFLAEMPPDAAAGVLASMQPDRAYAVSLLLASRHADSPMRDAANEARQ
ncbi:MAG: hypothetical protein AAF416_10255 [Pseudomonadota bacterium]